MDESIDPRRDVYLNHAGTSWPKPVAVADAVSDAMQTPPADWPARFEEAHHAIAEHFGVDQPEQILLTPGCTSALAVGIGDAMVASGKRVLTSRWEHHALHRPLLKSSDGPVEYIPANGDGPLDLDWLEQRLSARDVGLVAMTAACNVTGDLLPYEEATALAQQVGAMVVIDAAQVVGWQRLDLQTLGADLVAFGGHKGLQGPWGIGGLYVSERARMECVSATCELPRRGEGHARSPRPGYCDVGSVDQVALAGLHAGVRWLAGQDAGALLDSARAQIRRFRTALETVDGVRFLGSPDSNRRMPTLAFSIGERPSMEIASHLRRHGVMVGSGVHCAPLAHQTLGTEATGLVRLSVGIGQDDGDIDVAIERMIDALSR